MAYVVSILVTLLGVYLAIGFLFALAFVWKGIGKVDNDATSASVGFRLLILPGSMVLWPVLLRRWLKRRKT